MAKQPAKSKEVQQDPITALRIEIRDLQRSVRLGDAANPHAARNKRRELARLLTAHRAETASKETK